MKQNSRLQKSIKQYKDVIQICLPLVLGMSATTIMEFTDRVFLANYSLDSVAAAMPAGITAFLFMAFLGGTGSYTSVFIAQYFGRGEYQKIGPVLWQGIYFCLFSAFIFLLAALFTTDLFFDLANHPEPVKTLEKQYYTILCYGGVFHVALNTISTFFTGRGITKPVMAVYFIGMIVNIPLNYMLIFGVWIFPELGIVGAGIATVVSWFLPTVILLFMIFTRHHEQQFCVFSKFIFDAPLFRRILKFGIPGSLQFTIDILAFTIFTLLIGRISTIALAATTIVISINSLAFMPSMGVSQGLSVMVGQALGKNQKDMAKTAVYSSSHLLLIYIIFTGICFLCFPEIILSLFISKASPDKAELTAICVNLLKIITAYLILDSMYMIFSGALRGAGDNRFLMWSAFFASLFCLIIPCSAGIIMFNQGLYFAWFCVLIFIAALFATSLFRYRQGKWVDMLVIETDS